MRGLRTTILLSGVVMWAQVGQTPSATLDRPLQTAINRWQAAVQVGDAAIEGTTVDAMTGEPVRKAIVTLVGTTERTVTSGADGRFVFDRLPEGGYGVKGSRTPGMMAPPILPVQLAKSARVSVVVKVTAPAAVSGRVLDEDGDPMVGVMVSVLRADYSGGKPQWVPAESATTDDHGEYRIHSVTPGRYRLQAAKINVMYLNAMPRRYSRIDQTDEVPYAAMFHPNTRDVSAAATVKLGPAAEFRADFRMEKSRLTTISGRVAGGPEDPGGISVHPEPRESEVAMSMRTQMRWNEDGTFTITGVPPGRYWLVATTSRLNETPMAGITAVDTTRGPVSGLTVTMMAGTEITGRLQFEGEIDTKEPRYLRLTPAGNTVRGPQPSPVEVDAGGRFRIPNVLPGIWDVHAELVPPGGYIKSMKFGAQDVLRKGLEIGIDGLSAGGELEIVVSTKGAQIEGMVGGAKPLMPVQVIAIPEGEESWVPAFRQMDVAFRDGRYRVEGLRPGKYRVYAISAETEAIGLRDPDVLEALKTKSAVVTVEESGRVTQDLTLITSEDVAKALLGNL